MIPAENRAERLCIDCLLGDAKVVRAFTKKALFQGYMEPDTLATYDAYVLVKRIDSRTVDNVVDGTPTDRLRRVRVQVDVSDTSYSRMARNSEIVRDALERGFPSCIDGDTYGTTGIGQKVFNVCSIDIILYEKAV